MTDLKSFENTSYDRLIAAVRTQWASVGAAAMSARQISALTAVPVSSIYHHFGSMEHLFAAAQGSAYLGRGVGARRRWIRWRVCRHRLPPSRASSLRWWIPGARRRANSPSHGANASWSQTSLRCSGRRRRSGSSSGKVLDRRDGALRPACEKHGRAARL
ncbi:helix-turn-helix domain-containing protein [Novosphingobium panipatense]